MFRFVPEVFFPTPEFFEACFCPVTTEFIFGNELMVIYHTPWDEFPS